MPTAHGNGIDIEYVTSGDPADPALLLVMGLGAQLIAWPEAFVEQLTARGFFTIRYDNRDSGLSTKFEGTPDFAALFGGDASSVPYRIEDMAEDAIVVLDELGRGPRPRGRRLHGRHDHPGPRHQPPGAVSLRLLHHVDHGGPHRRCADRRGRRGPAAPAGDQPGGGRGGQPGGEQGDQLSGVPLRCRPDDPPRRGRLRPLPTAPRARRGSWPPFWARPTAPRVCAGSRSRSW